MTKKTGKKAVPSWAGIERRVLAGLNLEDVGTAWAVSRWQEHVEKIRGNKEMDEIVCAFTAPIVLDAAVMFFRADIEENRKIFETKLATNERVLTLLDLRNELGKAQGVFVEEDDGDCVVPELLGVVRATKTARIKKLEEKIMLRQLIKASRTLADNPEENAEEPSWPAGLGDSIQNFINDLTDFISEKGNEGREMVKRVCEDIDFAKGVCCDNDMPKPIRFLASAVVKVNAETLV